MSVAAPLGCWQDDSRGVPWAHLPPPNWEDAGRTFVRYRDAVERIEVDRHLLTWERHEFGAVLSVQEKARARPEATTTFRVTAGEGRLRVGLALLPTDRVVDVSLQPAIFTQVLPGGSGPCPPGSAGAQVARWLADLSLEAGGWSPADLSGVDVVGTAGGVVLPLLGAAYDQRATPVAEVPRWAEVTLLEPTATAAARAAFGGNGTRAVARALVAGLVRQSNPVPDGVTVLNGDHPTGVVRLWPLAVALMADGAVEPDHLARLLMTTGPAHDPASWPDVERLAIGSKVASHLGPAATRVLADVVSREDGPQLFEQICRDYPSVVDLLPTRPATRLEDLRDQCRSLLPVDPAPFGSPPQALPGRPARRPARRRVARDADWATERLRRDRALVAPPVADSEVDPAAVAAFRLPDSVTSLQGADIGDDLRLLVPRSASELAAWGVQMHTCVGTFAPAVAAGRSLILGIERHGTLHSCLEATSGGLVRQFLGVRNRTVPLDVATPVCRFLADAGVLDGDADGNRLWLGPGWRSRRSRSNRPSSGHGQGA